MEWMSERRTNLIYMEINWKYINSLIKIRNMIPIFAKFVQNFTTYLIFNTINILVKDVHLISLLLVAQKISYLFLPVSMKK